MYGQYKRVLVVAYLFPPVGGAGVQRVSKFVKYLAEHGWRATVLTVENPSVPVLDETLLLDVPPVVEIKRVRTLEPGYEIKKRISAGHEKRLAPEPRWKKLFRKVVRKTAAAVLQPDPQILWYPAAVKHGRRLLAETPHEVIFVTAPPFSAFLVGTALSRSSGLPLVLDYRDEWDISNKYWENRQYGPWSQWIQSRMQRRVLRQADAIVATTDASTKTLAELAAEVGSHARTVRIYNGFDSDDFRWPSQPARSDLCRISYVGTLWNLTSVEPLVQAVQLLTERKPSLAAKLELVFAGRRTAEQDEFVAGLRQTPCRLYFMPYVEHAEAIDLMLSSDALCLLLSDVPHADRVVPGKLFEYMATGRHILYIGPEGEAQRLLEPYSRTFSCRPSQVERIAEALEQLVKWKLICGDQPERPGFTSDRMHDLQYVQQFERRELARQLAKLLNELASEHRRKQPDVVPTEMPKEAGAQAKSASDSSSTNSSATTLWSPQRQLSFGI